MKSTKECDLVKSIVNNYFKPYYYALSFEELCSFKHVNGVECLVIRIDRLRYYQYHIYNPLVININGIILCGNYIVEVIEILLEPLKLNYPKVFLLCHFKDDFKLYAPFMSFTNIFSVKIVGPNRIDIIH